MACYGQNMTLQAGFVIEANFIYIDIQKDTIDTRAPIQYKDDILPV